MRSTKLSRPASHRRLLVKNMATSVLLYEKVQTTPAKARAIQSHAERLITAAKQWQSADGAGAKLAIYRRLLADTSDRLAAKKLVEVLASRYADRVGGYTRRIRLARRLGDGAEQVVVTLMDQAKDTPSSAVKTTPAEASIRATKTKDK